MRRLRRRLLASGVVTVAAVALAAGPAFAHFCYNNRLNELGLEQANAGRAGSKAFMSFEDLAFEFTGLCPAGIQVLADAAGVTTDTTINIRAVMAGGTLKKEDGGGTPAISHLDFEAIDAAFPDAIAACEA